jgi:chemotaxis protein methyltransferase CheR
VFEQLRQNILPQLLSRGDPLRIWSAACSDGQELYSVGMLLEELGCLADCELVGTDLRSEAINQARSGIFARSSLDQLDELRRRRFFTEGGNSAVIHPVLRSRTNWEVADLLRGAEAGPWDLILWRNMAIYLENEAADRVWEELCAVLQPGGYLIGGRADIPPKWLPLKRVGPCTYQKGDN